MMSQDSVLYRLGEWVVNLFVLNALWALCSIPLVTIGASTTALFSVTRQWVKGKEPPLLSHFWKGFKENFLQATLIWIILATAGVMLSVNLRALIYSGQEQSFLYILQWIAAVELVLLAINAFSLLAHYQVTVLGCIRSAFFITNKHLGVSISILALLLGLLWLLYYWPVLILWVMGVLALGISFMQVRVFDAYSS